MSIKTMKYVPINNNKISKNMYVCENSKSIYENI